MSTKPIWRTRATFFLRAPPTPMCTCKPLTLPGVPSEQACRMFQALLTVWPRANRDLQGNRLSADVQARKTGRKGNATAVTRCMIHRDPTG